MMNLQIWILRIGEDAKHAQMPGIPETANEIEDHRLGPVHSATTDYLQDLHVQSAVRLWVLFLVDARRPTASRRPGPPGTPWPRSSSCIDIATSTTLCFAAEVAR